ncbi:MAG: SEC-C domain-containing protein, partial [Kiritimatiellaeota bacterium]|nr:SEC-C domain-containing protein [Kiritimatiellota bacterium]
VSTGLDVGNLSQTPVLILAALPLLARGERVVMLDRDPWTGGAVRGTAQALETLGVRVARLDAPVPAPLKPEDYHADLVLADVLRVGTDLHRKPELFDERPTTLFVANLDLTLYDRRLLVFENGTFRVAAAVVRSTDTPPEWFEHENLFDWRRHMHVFTGLRGTGSDLSPEVARELRHSFGLRCRRLGAPLRLKRLPALLYATFEEKTAALCEDVRKVDGDVLVFAPWSWTAALVRREIGRLGFETFSLSNEKDLTEFVTAKAPRKRVGVFAGIPSPEWRVPKRPENMGVGLFEPFLFQHHQRKIQLFCERSLTCGFAPCLYFATEDADDIWTFARPERLERAFQLMDRLEKTVGARWVRAWFGARLLQKCYRTRRKFWHEESPAFTYIHAASRRAERQPRRERKPTTDRFDTPCFCGSGKPFRECHGKTFRQSGAPGR